MFLAFDTSTDFPFLVITDGEKIFYEASFEKGVASSERLMEKVKEGMDLLKIEAESIKALIVGVGPGSYTGIRVSVMMAKTWNFTLKTPLIRVYSLWAWNFFPLLDEKKRVISPCLDARIAGFYACKREVLPDGLYREKEMPKEVSVEEFSSFSEGVDYFLVLQGKNPFHKLGLLAPQNEKIKEVIPDPLFFAQQGIKIFFEKGGESHAEIEALYLRKTQAERESSSS